MCLSPLSVSEPGALFPSTIIQSGPSLNCWNVALAENWVVATMQEFFWGDYFNRSISSSWVRSVLISGFLRGQEDLWSKPLRLSTPSLGFVNVRIQAASERFLQKFPCPLLRSILERLSMPLRRSLLTRRSTPSQGWSSFFSIVDDSRSVGIV